MLCKVWFLRSGISFNIRFFSFNKIYMHHFPASNLIRKVDEIARCEIAQTKSLRKSGKPPFPVIWRSDLSTFPAFTAANSMSPNRVDPLLLSTEKWKIKLTWSRLKTRSIILINISNEISFAALKVKLKVVAFTPLYNSIILLTTRKVERNLIACNYCVHQKKIYSIAVFFLSFSEQSNFLWFSEKTYRYTKPE